MKKIEVTIKTHNRNELQDITSILQEEIDKHQIPDGKITIWIPHTTAAVTINENADPDVQVDMITGLNRISPNLNAYRHMEGNSDSHIKSSMLGCNQDLIVYNGRIFLGTWQGVYFCEFDGPRTRRILIFY